MKFFALMAFLVMNFSSLAQASPVWQRYDQDCRLSPYDRNLRRNALVREWNQVSRKLAVAQTSLMSHLEDLKDSETAYTASSISWTISSVAGTFAGGLGTATMISEAGGIVAAFSQLGNVIRTTDFIVGPVLIFGGYRIVRTKGLIEQWGKQFPASLDPMDLELRRELERLSSQPIDLSPSLGLVDGRGCGPQGCPLFSPELRSAQKKLQDWYADQDPQFAVSYGLVGTVFEFLERGYVNRLQKLEVPYALASVQLYQLELAYLSTLKDILYLDAESCVQEAR